MLKKLVRERLIAAADEIFGLFARTIASYEEQLCRAREETERHRRQLKAVYNTHSVLHVEAVQQHRGSSSLGQEDKQAPHHEEEVAHPQQTQVKKEEEETDISKFPAFVESEDDKDKPRAWSELHYHSPSGDHCGGPPPDNLLAPLSDSDDMEGPLKSDADCEGDDKLLTFFKNEATLVNKDNSQTRKKLSICSVCGKHFASNSVLIIHMRKHTGERPFVCSVCGKAFIQKSHLASHMITHTGEKPFSCPICGIRFSYKCNWNTHMRKHKTE